MRWLTACEHKEGERKKGRKSLGAERLIESLRLRQRYPNLRYLLSLHQANRLEANFFEMFLHARPPSLVAVGGKAYHVVIE